jgi:hypothetical protein
MSHARPIGWKPGPPSPLHLAALAYAAEGWPVFLLSPGEKTPATRHGCLEATCDRNQIDAWWEAVPTGNIGLATGAVSGLVVVDVDAKAGKRGDRTLVEFVRDRGPIPWTRETLTPSGGAHLVFALPPGVEIRNSRDRVGPGIDVRGEGGYIVAPPSVLPGGAYAWLDAGAPLAELGGWLLAACLSSGDVEQGLPAPAADFTRYRTRDELRHRLERAVAYVDRIDAAVAGRGGHDQTWLVAQHLVRGFEIPPECALEVLRHFNRRCVPPWSEAELRHKIESAATTSNATPGYLADKRGAA